MTVQPAAAELSAAKLALLRRRLQGAPPVDAGPTVPRRPAGAPVPLSFAQRRMWFLEQLEPGTGVFNLPEVLRLRGPLDHGALERAWAAVVGRHEALRTVLGGVDDEPVQLVADEVPVAVPLVDLSDLPAPERERQARQWAERDVQAPFRLTGGPLWRVRLLRLAADDHVLVLVVHHSVGDDWSSRILFDDLAAFYAGRPTPEPAVQYGDVAAWQRAGGSAPRAAALAEYWQRALAGAPALLDLPTDRPRPPVQGAAGGEVARALSGELPAAVTRLAAAEGVTPFVVLLTAYAAVLARYTGSEDVPVGAPVAGRDLPELDRVVGCLLNTLVLRVDLAGEPTFRQLLARTRRTVLDAFGHADLPFEHLVELLDVQRSLAHAPLYQAMFNLIEGGSGEPLQLPGVRSSYLDGVALGSTKADLSLTASRGPDGLYLHLSYRRELFDHGTAADLLDRFVHLLGGAVADPDRCWLDLPLGPVEVPAGAPPAAAAGTAVEMFDAQVARTPEATALVSGAASVTYRQLAARVDRVAAVLRSRGVRPGGLVAIAVDRSVEMAVAVLGVLKAGGAYVPVDPAHPAARQAALLDRVRPALLVTAGPARVPFGGDQLDLSTLDWNWAEPPAATGAPPGPDDLAYVVHTSGSTGAPKGVLSRHRGVANYLSFVHREYGVGPDDTVLQIAGLGFDASVRDLLGPLTAGARVVLLDPDQAKEPAAMLDLARRHRVTCLLSVVPTLLRALVTVGGPPVPSLRLVLCSGERLFGADVAAARQLFGPQVRVVNQYGPTECTMTSTFQVADAGPAAETVPAGRPIPGARLYVLDGRGRPVPAGVPGEVYLGGVGVAAGYLGDPEQTAERFRPDPFAGGDARTYRTGDRGRLRSDGTLLFLGRVDDQVKIRGMRVEPGEVEAALRGAPGVRDAAVVAVAEQPPQPPRLVGYLVGGEVDAVRAHLRERLPDYLVPAVLVPIDALPRTATGKVDRRALPAPPARPAGGPAHVGPRTATERRVADAFATVLGLDRVGVDDHFFDAGGDSFAAVAVTRLVGGGMRVLDLFRTPTVAALAAALDRAGDDAGGAGDRLLVELTPAAAARQVSLVCVPYAGGSPISFQPLAAALPDRYAVYGVALPGHELARPDEPIRPLDEVARAVADEVCSTVAGPVALYGHCSGAALAVEIARLLEAAGRRVDAVYLAASFPNTRLPGRLFGRFTLDRLASDRTYHTFFRAMGGFGDDLSPVEIGQIVKNLRHDSTAAENYFTRTIDDPDRDRLAAPIVCIVGDRDPLTEYFAERHREWLAYSDRVRLAVLERAGHYFLKHRADAVARIVAGTEEPDRAGTAPPEPVAVPAGARARSARHPLGVFAAVAASQFVSLLGSSLTAFALGVWIYQRTGSVSLLGAIAVCALLPSIVISPLAGAVVDRVDRRLAMLAGDLGAGLGTLLIAALLWTDRLQTWHLYVILSWSSACGAFQRPAYVSAIPQLIPKRYLARANGLALSAEAGSQVLAPLVGGALVVSIGLTGVILVDVATFLVSVGTLLAVRFPNRLPWRRREPLLTEIAGGWRYLLARRGILALLLQAAACNLLLAVMAVLVTPLVLRTIGDPGVLGLVLAAGGVGALLGGLTMSIWGGPRRLVVGILNFSTAGGLFIALLGAGTSIAPMLVGMFGFWFTLAVSNACYTVLIQVKVPHHLHGRVFALNQMVAFSTMPVGYVLAGPLTDHVFEPLLAAGGPLAGTVGAVLGTGPGRGIALLMVVLGALTVAANLAGYALPRLRRLESEVPDAHPDEAIARPADPRDADLPPAEAAVLEPA